VSRNALVAVIAGAVFVVTLLAVLTPTVIVDDRDGGARSVRVLAPAPAPAEPAPFPFRRGSLPDFRRCLRSHGLERATPPGVDKLRGALRDCLRPRLR
jgi:hypothetical protein